MAQEKDSAKSTAKSGRNSGIKNLTPFKKGQSGNPSGRPKIPEDIKQAFKDLTPIAIKTLTEIVQDPKAKQSDRIKASEIILDRGYGKPVQSLDVDARTTPTVVFMNEQGIKD